ncbi:hypothetical protein ACFX5E_00330 [Flavobacterium sp. LS2P90]|uniref:Uncharacterized protein n=1 Tax=Flavobacterium xylosi TaxID=3230415 RepID=A0ABW6HR83_9FLAO
MRKVRFPMQSFVNVILCYFDFLFDDSVILKTAKKGITIIGLLIPTFEYPKLSN